MIQLRNYRPSDAGVLVALANNRNVSRYLVATFPYPYTERDAVWWIEEGATLGGAITRVIELDGQFVGSVGLTPQAGWQDHIAEIGYWIGEPFWGKGLATVALREMSSWAFAEHGFRKLIAPVLAPNLASMRVLEKCGYACEGILKAEVCRDEVLYDIHRYAKLRD